MKNRTILSLLCLALPLGACTPSAQPRAAAPPPPVAAAHETECAEDAALPVPTAAAAPGSGSKVAQAPLSSVHPYYRALQDAHRRETDPGRRAVLAANLARWERMPAYLGDRYILVNAPAFEAMLWDDGAVVGRWPVIIGRRQTPTPVFDTTVTGVIFNPWWNVPASIVAESVGALVRNRPAEARRRGYVVQDGRYRQRPGPGNALGLVKLDMPNPYSVGMHDTPNRDLFQQEVRAFSHGCIRVGDALGFATTVLSTEPGWDRARVDQAVAAGETLTVPLAEPIPIYVAYFTAVPDGEGGIRYYDDIYRRD